MLRMLSPQEYVEKGRSATLKERSAAQEHFSSKGEPLFKFDP